LKRALQQRTGFILTLLRPSEVRPIQIGAEVIRIGGESLLKPPAAPYRISVASSACHKTSAHRADQDSTPSAFFKSSSAAGYSRQSVFGVPSNRRASANHHAKDAIDHRLPSFDLFVADETVPNRYEWRDRLK